MRHMECHIFLITGLESRATTLGFRPGWKVRENEKGLYFVDHKSRTVTKTDPRFAVGSIQEATERLALRHTFRPHSCEHCEKIIVKIKSSPLKKATLRSSFNDVRVWCANSPQDIECALGDGCPLFTRLFRSPLVRSDVTPENGGIFLTVKHIHAEREFRDFDETWQKHCFIFYKSKRLRDEARVPKLQLCGDPQPGQ